LRLLPLFIEKLLKISLPSDKNRHYPVNLLNLIAFHSKHMPAVELPQALLSTQFVCPIFLFVVERQIAQWSAGKWSDIRHINCIITKIGGNEIKMGEAAQTKGRGPCLMS
jgi:hypothetical protein